MVKLLILIVRFVPDDEDDDDDVWAERRCVNVAEPPAEVAARLLFFATFQPIEAQRRANCANFSAPTPFA